MAPECTSNLAVLDLQIVGSEVECDVDRLDVTTAAECLHVSWNATQRPDGTDPMGKDVVFVWRPSGYYRRRYHSKPDRLDSGFSWVHPVQGELMLVLALPPAYVLPSVDDAQPILARCKELAGQERMAAYWMLTGGSRAQVTWQMKPLQGDMRAHLAALNDEAAKRAPVRNFGTIIDGEHLEGTQPPPTTFIIHGHDHTGVSDLKEFIKQLNLPDPVVMKDQLVSGATLPEKFEQLAETAGLAIALLTPDDLGGAVADPSPLTPIQQSARARQNAWLEIGWFWGRLGRDHIMLLVKGDIEIPSDLRGLEYYRYRNNVAELADRIQQFYKEHQAL
jgi:Predicted nucleotide-binding protein containing TIR-like domain